MNFSIRRYGFVYRATLLLCLALSQFAYAESIVYSTLESDLIAKGASGPDRPTQFLQDPMVSVTYNIRVSEVDAAGNIVRVLPSGSVVPQNTRVLYEFMPHLYSDIYWFATGNTWDSPYGDWLSGASAPPASERCAPKNMYDEDPFGTIIFKIFAALSVNPPQKSVAVSAPSNPGCVQDGLNKICTLNATETVTAQFTFDPTIGKFYPGFYSDNSVPKYAPLGVHRCSQASETYGTAREMERTAYDNQNTSHQAGGSYTLDVPEQTLSHVLIVTEETPNVSSNTPTAPVVSSAGSACLLDTPYTVQMNATDPNGDRIRYGIDWDNNGTVDQFVPPSGYVASGTTVTAARTYTTEGTKTIRVFAQDEGGLTSSVTTFSFDCAAAAELSSDETSFVSGVIPTGPTVSSMGPADLSLRVIPSLVSRGGRTRVHWSSVGVDSCTVTATNTDTWSQLQSSIAGEVSSPITEQTRYTLRCVDSSGSEYTRTAQVSVLPLWNEI